MIAMKPPAMMNTARLSYLEARYAAPQMENAATAYGGTVILSQFIETKPLEDGGYGTYSCACHAWNPSPAIMVGCKVVSLKIITNLTDSYQKEAQRVQNKTAGLPDLTIE